MKRLGRQVFIGLLATTLVLGSLSGCNKNTTPASSTAGETSSNAGTASADSADSELSGADKYPEELTIDVFDSQANYQGVQSGWYGKIVKEKFNMELNIIAPNVAGGGDTLFQTRSAAGNLGDLVFIGSENGRLSDTSKAGLLLDLTDKIESAPDISKYSEALKMSESLVEDGKLYAIPSQVSTLSATTPSEGLDLTYGPYIRWDYYEDLGCPKIKTMDDLLPILQEMQQKHPTSDSGKTTYAFSLFADWDGNMMCLGKNILACIYGYDENGFQLLSADGHTAQSIIDNDSWYIKGLEYFFKANQMGLVDPDSSTQNYDTMFAKYQDGQVLYSPWPWLGQAAYNTTDHKAANKGFMLAPVEDLKIYSYGCSPSGNKYMVGIGSKAQGPDRMLDFLDWLYSPEGVEISCAQTSKSCGPEGLTWEIQDSKPVLTDFGKQAFAGNEIQVPSEWGTGTWKDGISQLNYQAVLALDIDPNIGVSYNYNTWDSYLADNSTPLDTSWQTTMKAETSIDWLEQHNAYVVSPGNNYVPEAAGTEIDTERTQCNTIIKQDSWKMVFAKDQAEFDSILKDMQTTVEGLGYDDVLAFDQKISDNYAAARDVAVK